jgi:hypothetical protein
MLRRCFLFLALWLMVLLPGCVPTHYARSAGVSLSKYNDVFIGWVDLGPGDWKIWDYKSQDEWVGAIDRLNAQFQRMISDAMPNRNITGAKEPGAKPEPGPGLVITFSKVRIKRDMRRVEMDVTFSDRKTGEVLFTITGKGFKGDSWAGMENDIWYSLESAKKMIAGELRS